MSRHCERGRLTMDDERLHVTDATREKSSREERHTALPGGGRRAEAAEQAESERQSVGLGGS